MAAVRKCQGCQKVQPRDLMIKITRDFISGELFVNPGPKITGRSVYVCKNMECIKTLLKKKRIERSFKGKALSEQDLTTSLEDKCRQ